jgi:AcrR family transcriptional regulator
MAVQDAPIRRPGRPRDEHADEAILRATLHLVGRQGVQGTTIAAVAETAGVGKATIHRRWRTKTALLLAALGRFEPHQSMPDTGSVREDLVQYHRFFVRLMSGPRRDVLPSLLSEGVERPELREALAGFVAQRRSVLRQILERGVERGELRDDVDLDLALDLFSGPLVYRTLVAGLPVDDEVAPRLIDLVLLGLRKAG